MQKELLPRIEPIVVLEEVKIQSVVDEKKHQKWVDENIKHVPPKNVTQDQRNQAKEKIKHIQQLKTSKSNLL